MTLRFELKLAPIARHEGEIVALGQRVDELLRRGRATPYERGVAATLRWMYDRGARSPLHNGEEAKR